MGQRWWTVSITASLAGAILLTTSTSVSSAPLQRIGHTDMAWTVTDADDTPPPDAFGGSNGRPWAGSDRVWNQPGFTGAYTIVFEGREVAAYCGDFHNARNPDGSSRWVSDPNVFQGSDKALTKLSYVQWRWGATADPDIGAGLNLYTHFLGSPGDRSNSSGVPVPDINDNDVLDEIVSVLPPHHAVGPIMSMMDRAAEAWSAAFEHRSSNVALGVELVNVAGESTLRSVATGRPLPDGSFDLDRAADSTTAVTAGVGLALSDITNGSQHTLTAGQPLSAELAAISEVTLQSQISATDPSLGALLTDAIDIVGLIGGATAEVHVQLFDLTSDPDATGPPLAEEVRDGLPNGATGGFARFEVVTEVAGHRLGYRHRLVGTSDGALPGAWSVLGIESETGRATPLQAEVHLRKLVASQNHPAWVEAQRNAPWSHEPDPASLVPRAGSFDDSAPGPYDGLPVFGVGDVVSFRYELWLDDAATGAVSWGEVPSGVVVDDAGTPMLEDDDVAPEFVDGDDGDGLLEHGEIWLYEAIGQRTATPGEMYLNTAHAPPGAVVDPWSGRHDGDTTAPRQDPAGYVVPCVSTSATDRVDGDRSLAPNGGVIVDVVTYCNLVPGVEYTADAAVIDRLTEATTRHTGSTTFTPTAPDGVVEVEIVVAPDPGDSSVRAGIYVVFEGIRIAASDRVVVAHADIDDAAQTFDVAPLPEPESEPEPAPPLVPPEPAPPVREIPRTGDDGGRIVADLGSIVFIVGVGLLCIAWWRRPDADNPHSLEA